MTGLRRLSAAALAAALLMLAGPGPAGADDWRPVGTACIAQTGTDGCVARTRIGGEGEIALSPDGRHVYLATFLSVELIDRDPATGALTQRAGSLACVSRDGTSSSGTCQDGEALSGISDLALSADGAFLYVTSAGSVSTFRRNPTTGILTQLDCISDDGAAEGVAAQCTNGRGMASARRIAISPDGENLYLAGQTVAVFDRNTTSGLLLQKGAAAGCLATVAVDGCGPAKQLGFASQIDVSPDGRTLTVPMGSTGSGGIAIFERDTTTGEVAQRPGVLGCITPDGAGGACIAEPRFRRDAFAAQSSPDGRHVHVATSAGVFTFARSGSGDLALQSCLVSSPSAGCTVAPNVFSEAAALANSPDGADVALTVNREFGPDAVVFLARDAATGDLAPRPLPDGCLSAAGRGFDGGGVIRNGLCVAHPAGEIDGQVAFADANRFLTASSIRTSVASFKRDFYPRCAGASVAVPFGAPAAAPLACADANGDALTLAIAQPPLSGTLGGIDPAGRVVYSPFAGFTGADAFSYVASDGTLTSAPATVSLAVAAPPPAPPGPPAAVSRIDAAVSSRWGVGGKRIFLLSLAVRRPPAGTRLELRCKGTRQLKCPFSRRRTSKRRNGSITLFKPLTAQQAAGRKVRRFLAGQRLQVRVTAPGRIGKVVDFALKRGRIPQGAPRCLPPGSTTPRRRC